MTNAISLPYSTSSGVYGTTLSSTYEWYVQWYQYPTNTATVNSSANIQINSIAQKQSVEKRNLPDGYVQLEYIQSGDTQYIDTKFMPNQDTRVVMDVQMISENSSLAANDFFGARTSTSSKAFAVQWNTSNDYFQEFYNNGYTNLDFGDNTIRQIIELNKNVISINGVVSERDYAAFQCDYTLFLFALNNAGAASFFSNLHVYSCQIYDNGTLIRDYVPCMNANGIVGLYDLVNNEFYTNAGTGNFIGGNLISARSLPSGYKQVPYLACTGTQYFDTGFKPNQNTRTVMDIDVVAQTEQSALFGSRTGYQNTCYSVFTSDNNAGYQVDYANSAPNGTATYSGGRHFIDYDKNIFYVDGKVEYTHTTSTYQTAYNMYLLSVNASNSAMTAYPITGNLYSCKIWDNDILIRDYIPCINSEGVLGLYDLVNNSFYTNIGTGEFTAPNYSANDNGVNVNISIYSKNAITRTGTSGYTCSTFTFKSQPTILLNNKTLSESIEVYDMALTTTVADNGAGTAVSGSIVHASTLDVTVPSSWFIEENRQWYFTISDLITIVDTGVTHTNTKTFNTFVVDALYNVWVKKSISLPDGYTQLKYIESTGTQYVDTGFMPNQDTSVLINFNLMTATTAYIYGCRGNSSDNYNNRYGLLYTGDALFRSDYGDGNGLTFPSTYTIGNIYLSDKQKNECSLGGTLVTNTNATFQSPRNMFLFGINEGTGFAYGSSVRIYSCKIWDNGTLIRNYIPCLNPSNVAGLYDLVNGVFYNDASGGVFNYPATSYTPVEYLESSGTQYVDTGFKHNQNTRVVMDAQVTTQPSTHAWLFEGRIKNTSAAKGIFLLNGSEWCADYSSSSYDRVSITSVGVTDRLNIDYNKNTLTVNSFTKTWTQVTFQSTCTLTLLGANTNGTVSGFISAKLYSCQIYDNGNLVRDFIPVLDSNNVACLYDKVSETFFYNKGTGTFTTGSTIRDSITVPNSNATLNKAIQIYVKKNGTLFPMTNMYAKVGGAVV